MLVVQLELLEHRLMQGQLILSLGQLILSLGQLILSLGQLFYP